jgi:hypothetical protein
MRLLLPLVFLTFCITVSAAPHSDSDVSSEVSTLASQSLALLKQGTAGAAMAFLVTLAAKQLTPPVMTTFGLSLVVLYVR